MTKAEFMTELAKDKGQFQLTTEPIIKGVNGEYHEEIGEGVVRSIGPTGRKFCPITKVVHRLTGKFFSIREVNDAAGEIKLEVYDTKNIVNAADNLCFPEFEVRVEMLRVLGL